jgi:hypothetical protein
MLRNILIGLGGLILLAIIAFIALYFYIILTHTISLVCVSFFIYHKFRYKIPPQYFDLNFQPKTTKYV